MPDSAIDFEIRPGAAQLGGQMGLPSGQAALETLRSASRTDEIWYIASVFVEDLGNGPGDWAADRIVAQAHSGPIILTEACCAAGELWDLLVVDDNGTIKLANPGTIKRTSAMDASGLVTVVDVGQTFIPAPGEFLVLSVKPDLTTTLTVEGQWDGWPMPVESEESTPAGLWVLKTYHYVLWEFVATPASGHRTVKITDSVSAVKRCPSENLQFLLGREEDAAGHVVSAYTLQPAPGCQTS